MSVLTYVAYPWLAGLATTQAFYMLALLGVPYAAFAARALCYIMCLILSAAYGCIASIIMRLFGVEHSAQCSVGRVFQFLMRILTNIRVQIEDPHNYLGTVRPAVFIGPHQSELDILVLGAVFPKHCSVTAKASLKKMPVLGWFMSLSGSVFIDRANSKSARGAMQGAADEMKRRGQSVWMFPEGTRSYAEDAGLLPFKKGAFHLAVQAGVPIVPVVVANYANVFSMKRKVFNSGTVMIKVLPPIDTKNLTAADVEDLTRDTRELMEKTMLELTAKQRGHPVKLDAKLAAMSAAGSTAGSNGVIQASSVQATTTALS